MSKPRINPIPPVKRGGGHILPREKKTVGAEDTNKFLNDPKGNIHVS